MREGHEGREGLQICTFTHPKSSSCDAFFGSLLELQRNTIIANEPAHTNYSGVYT